jgi:TRAP-type C4-dicarboxylate transport system permease small subunit
MKYAQQAINRISVILNGVSCAALGALMLLVSANVILRAVFKAPILGTYDLSGFATVILIGCGLAYCSLDNGHIEIGFFVEKLNKKARIMVTAAGRMISFAFLGIYTYALFKYGLQLMRANEVSVTTKTPLFIFVFILSLCFCVFSLTVFIRIFTVKTEEGGENGS